VLETVNHKRRELEMDKNNFEKDKNFAEVDLFSHLTEEHKDEISAALCKLVFRTSILFVDFGEITQERVYLLFSDMGDIHVFLDEKEAREEQKTTNLEYDPFKYYFKEVSREAALEMKNMTESDRHLLCEGWIEDEDKRQDQKAVRPSQY
jgi:hypothetical protein